VRNSAAQARAEIERLAFRRTWRPYQQRVLEAATLDLADRKLHVVAAPGSGKTTLGLEIFHRLGEPGIVLSPTRTIRDQWIERLRDFIADGTPWPPAWVSRTLDAPGALTSITYQALHTKAREDEHAESEHGERGDEADENDGAAPLDNTEIEAVAATLKAAGVRTIILDEAHHLRAEWWKALTRLFERLGDVSVISLTATPPYDAVGHEWARYEELCGPIDEEISVPELVKAQTLSPHQDFVWAVVASERESEVVTRYVQDVTTLVQELLVDEQFATFVTSHPWITAAKPDMDAIFAEPETAMALLCYHKARSVALPERLLSLLDLKADDVPELTLPRWERLLAHYLFSFEPAAPAPELTAHRQKLARRLRDSHLLLRRQITLADPKPVKRQLTQSVAKIGACLEIHRHERALRGESLRQVILTDYIRDDDVDDPSADEPRALGARPIFRELARAVAASEMSACALLTGRLVVVHEQLLPRMAGMFASSAPLPQLPGFWRLTGTDGAIVGALTRCLSAGTLRCLVGTRSLLGEGWDAPCVNSLVIASTVGAYMLTNQMRGRALRVDKDDPQKVASVWHIVAVAFDRRPLGSLFRPETVYWPGMLDLQELDFRFKTFVGLDVARGVIENSLVRLQLPCFKRELDSVTGAERITLQAEWFRNPDAVRSMNELMVRRLNGLSGIQQDWQNAIDKGASARVVPSVKAHSPPRLGAYHVRLTWMYFFLVAVVAFASVASFAALVPRAVLAILGIAALYALPKFLRAAWLAYRHLPIDGSLHQIGLAVRDSLCALRIIDSPSSRIAVESQSFGGSAYINIEGGSFRDQALFSDCMREILNPIENPRYLIVREGTSLGMKRKDYHAVPACLGVRKDCAELFLDAWRRRVGPAQLIYTRTPEQRAILLQARARAFSNAAARAAERIERWM
jgi:superfamily II DNA or RNA helicase